MSCVLLSLLGFIALSFWKEFGRYQAYGEIEGTVIRLSAFAPGRIASIVVDEGDLVRAGDVLAVVDAHELQMNMRRLKSDLQIALSNLRVRMAELSERSRLTFAERVDRRVDYHRILGELHLKQARLKELKITFANNESLRASNAVSDTEYIASKSAFEGLQSEIADLQSAVAVLEAEVNSDPEDHVNELLQAEQARIVDIQSELDAVESMINASDVIAPVDGRIVKRHCHAGEFVDPKQPIVELLQTNSVEAVVYLPQPRANLLSVGESIQLVVAPLGEQQAFRVSCISPELVPPPQSLQANYRAFKGLVRVRAVPVDSSNDLSRWMGAELALPRFGYRTPDNTSLLTRLGFTRPTNSGSAEISLAIRKDE